EAFEARVVVPNVVDGPEVVLWNELLEAFAWWNRRTRARLGVVPVRATSFQVGEPIDRRNVFVRTGHLHARLSRHRRRAVAGRRDDGIRPIEFLLDGEIVLLNGGRRRIVAAIEPHQNARMLTQHANHALERFSRDFVLLLLPVAPLLPGVATSPARH